MKWAFGTPWLNPSTNNKWWLQSSNKPRGAPANSDSYRKNHAIQERWAITTRNKNVVKYSTSNKTTPPPPLPTRSNDSRMNQTYAELRKEKNNTHTHGKPATQADITQDNALYSKPLTHHQPDNWTSSAGTSKRSTSPLRTPQCNPNRNELWRTLTAPGLEIRSSKLMQTGLKKPRCAETFHNTEPLSFGAPTARHRLSQAWEIGPEPSRRGGGGLNFHPPFESGGRIPRQILTWSRRGLLSVVARLAPISSSVSRVEHALVPTLSFSSTHGAVATDKVLGPHPAGPQWRRSLAPGNLARFALGWRRALISSHSPPGVVCLHPFLRHEFRGLQGYFHHNNNQNTLNK